MNNAGLPVYFLARSRRIASIFSRDLSDISSTWAKKSGGASDARAHHWSIIRSTGHLIYNKYGVILLELSNMQSKPIRLPTMGPRDAESMLL